MTADTPPPDRQLKDNGPGENRRMSRLEVILRVSTASISMAALVVSVLSYITSNADQVKANDLQQQQQDFQKKVQGQIDQQNILTPASKVSFYFTRPGDQTPAVFHVENHNNNTNITNVYLQVDGPDSNGHVRHASIDMALIPACKTEEMFSKPNFNYAIVTGSEQITLHFTTNATIHWKQEFNSAPTMEDGQSTPSSENWTQYYQQRYSDVPTGCN